MDFALSKEQKDIQKAAREFAKGEFDKELAIELEVDFVALRHGEAGCFITSISEKK